MKSFLYTVFFTLLSVATHAQTEPSKHIIGLAFRSIRTAEADKINVTWRTDFAAENAIATLTGDAGTAHVRVSHDHIKPQQQAEGVQIVASTFTTEFTYGAGKEIFPELTSIHIDIVTQNGNGAAAVNGTLDIDLRTVADYFSILNNNSALQKQVGDLQEQLGRAPAPATIKVEQVKPLDTSISFHVQSDTAVRVVAKVYLGSASDITAGNEAGESDFQTVASGDPKILIVRGLAPEKSYVLTIKDQRGRILAGPILKDQNGNDLKTLAAIPHAHVAITGQIVKPPKNVILKLSVHDASKVRATIQRQTPAGNWEDIGSGEATIKNVSHEDAPESVSVDATLDPNQRYRGILVATSAVEDPDKEDRATSEVFTGIRFDLFKTVTVKFTATSLVFSTESDDLIKMRCRAELPKISKTVPTENFANITASRAPSCEFNTAELLPKPEDANTSDKDKKTVSFITLIVDAIADDHSDRIQTETLALSADLPVKDAQGRTIDYRSIAQKLAPTGDGKPALKASGALANILKTFLAIAPAFL